MTSIFTEDLTETGTGPGDKPCDLIQSSRQPEKAMATIAHIVHNKKILQGLEGRCHIYRAMSLAEGVRPGSNKTGFSLS